MEKYLITRDSSSDVPSRVLSEIYRDVTFKRQMMATRVESVRADSKKVDDAPSWRGDHTFSSDAAKYSFLNFIEPDVAKTHPDWSKQKVRKEALVKFQQRLEQDLSYEQKESAHQETAVHWKVVESPTGTLELATEYGGETITLRQLWDHTREYAAFVGIAAAYNPEEERAQYAMEQAFIKGDAQAYISVLSHPDAVRYVQVWERDNDGGVLSKQIDLYKTTGRDFTHREGDMLVKHLATFTQSRDGAEVVTTESQYAHFIVQSGSLREQDIRTIAIVQATMRHESAGLNAVSYKKNEATYTPLLAHKESQETFSDVQLFVTDIINKKINQLKEMVAPQKVKQNMEQHVQEMHKSPVKNEIPSQIEPALGAERVNSVSSREVIKTDASTPIAEMLAQLVITKTAFNFGAKFPDFSGGSLYWLSTFVENKPQIETGEHPEAPQTISEAMFSMLRSVRVFFEKGNEAFTKIHWRSRLPLVDAAAQTVVTEGVNQAEAAKGEFELLKQIALSIKESQPVAIVAILQQLAHLIDSKKIASVETHISKAGDLPVATKMDRLESKKDASTALALFGIFYWVFLSYNQDRSKASKLSDVVNKDESVQKHALNDRGEGDQPPWVLLGIIWHLAMLREAAVVTSVQQNVTQKTPVTDPTSQSILITPALPMTGVIFPSSFVLE